MSVKKTIARSFTVETIEDGISVQAQYAPNANPTSGQIHTVWQNGDLYMRTRESDDVAWSSWHKIVGESGDETDFSFGISQYKTTANASTAPSDISSWSDAPLAVTTAKPYLWAKVQQKSWNASTQAYVVDSTRYIRLTGEDGYTVEAQYAPNNNPTSSQIHTTWQDGDLYMRTKQSNETTWSSWHKIVGENGGETDYSFGISQYKTTANVTTAPSDITTWSDAPLAVTTAKPYLWSKVQKKDGYGNNFGVPSYIRLTGEEADPTNPNILDGTGFIKNLDKWVITNSNVAIIDGGVNGQKGVRYTSAVTEYSVLRQNDIWTQEGAGILRGSTWYTVSYYCRGSIGYCGVGFYKIGSSSSFAAKGMLDQNEKIYADGDAITPTIWGVEKSFAATKDWKRHSVTFKTAATLPAEGYTASEYLSIILRFYFSGIGNNFIVDRNNFRSANWDTFGTIGRSETWSGAVNSGVVVGSIIYICGKPTDADENRIIIAKVTAINGNNAVATTQDYDLLYRDFSCIKIEEGTIATPWCLSENDKNGYDGQSAPEYTKEWYAWSNIASTLNAVTSPFTEPYSGWSTSIPKQGGYAYLWKKIVRYVWNENTREYDAETAQYFRMSGTNGTSITPKGTVNYAYSASSGSSQTNNLPPPSSSISGRMGIVQGVKKIFKCNQVAQDTYAWVDTSSTIDDGYTYTISVSGDLNGNYMGSSVLTNHLVMWSDEANAWVDLGQFKGDSGTTYYTHIAWATNVTYSGSTVTEVSGFVITKDASDTTHIWMGVYIDTNSGQDNSKAKLYTWSNTKGVQGNDAPIAFASPDKITILCDEYGNSLGLPATSVIFSLKVGTHNASVTSVSSGTSPTGVTVTGVAAYAVTIAVNTSATASGLAAGVTFTVNGTYDGKSYSAKITVALIGAVKGNQGDSITGPRGKTGRFYYYGGEFDSSNTTKTFIVNDAETPYFSHGVNAVTGLPNCHVYNPSENPSSALTMAQMWANSSQSWNNAPWQTFTNDFQYLMSRAIFSDYAHVGSSIFSGDWMLSQYGVQSRVISTEEKHLVYMCVKVDGQYPVSDLATLLDDADLWDEYKGYGYSDDDLETVADICKWAVSAMPSNSDDVRYDAIQTISNTSYQLFGLNESNLFSVFEPNISFDFLHGKAYLNDCNVKGSLIGRVSTPFTRIKNSSDWDGYGVKTTDDYGYTRHYLFINRMPSWNVQIEYMSGNETPHRRLILPVITKETLGVEIKIINVSGDAITVEGKPEKSIYESYGSYLLDGIQTTGYSNDQRTLEMDNQTMLKFVSVEIPTQYGEYGWIAIGEPQTIKSQV